MNSPRKNILFLTSWFPNRRKPLEGNFVYNHALCLQDIANVFVLYAKASDTNKEKFEIEKSTDTGISITKVYYSKSRLPVLAFLVNMLRYIRALKIGFATLSQKIEKVNLNVAFPAGLFALYLKRKGFDYDITEHWSGYLKQTNLYQKEFFLVKKLHRTIFRKANNIFVVSDYLGKALTEHQLTKEYQVLPNYIDSEIFKPSTKNENFTFIHISTLDEETKNFSGILRALEKLKLSGKIFKFILVGEADSKNALDKIKKHNLLDVSETYFHINSQELATKLSAAHCLIQFSNFETFSIVLAEAWLSGVKTIHSRCGGLTEISDEKLGVQIPKNNDEALFKAMLRAMKVEVDYDSDEVREIALAMFHKSRIINAYRTNNY